MPKKKTTKRDSLLDLRGVEFERQFKQKSQADKFATQKRKGGKKKVRVSKNHGPWKPPGYTVRWMN